MGKAASRSLAVGRCSGMATSLYRSTWFRNQPCSILIEGEMCQERYAQRRIHGWFGQITKFERLFHLVTSLRSKWFFQMGCQSIKGV